MRENVASLDIKLSSKQQRRLDAAKAPPQLNSYFIFGLPRDRIFDGSDVKVWSEGGWTNDRFREGRKRG